MKRWARRWGFPAGLVLLYLYAFPYFARIHHANEVPRIYLTQSIVERGTLRIDDSLRRYGYAVDTSSYGGHFYSNKAPGLSLMGVPVYAAMRGASRLLGKGEPSLRAQTYGLRLFCVTLPALAFLLVFWRLTGLYTDDDGARRAALAGYAIGTLAFPFALQFMSHCASMALLGSAFCLLLGTTSPRRLLVAGLAMGSAVLTDYQSAFFALPLGLLALVRVRPLRRIPWLALGLAPPIAALMLYHQACFGGPFRTGYTYATNPAFLAVHKRGLLGMTGPELQPLLSGLFSADNGLFVLSPWLAVGVLGILLACRHRRALGWVAASELFLAVALYASSGLIARGGWSIGPRYIAPVIPFLAAPAALGFAWLARRPALAVLGGALLCASIALHAGAALTFPHWPSKLRDPVVELAWPLVRDGYAPYNLGRLLGLPGRFSLIPAFALALLLAAWVAARALHHRLVALVGGLALLGLFLLAPRTDPPDDVAIARWVESIWEPGGR